MLSGTPVRQGSADAGGARAQLAVPVSPRLPACMPTWQLVSEARAGLVERHLPSSRAVLWEVCRLTLHVRTTLWQHWRVASPSFPVLVVCVCVCALLLEAYYWLVILVTLSLWELLEVSLGLLFLWSSFPTYAGFVG